MFSRLGGSKFSRGQQKPGGKHGQSKSHQRKLKSVLKELQVPSNNLDLFIKTYSSAVLEDRDVPQEDVELYVPVFLSPSLVRFWNDLIIGRDSQALETIRVALNSDSQDDQVAASCLLRAIMEDDTTAGVTGGMVALAAYNVFLQPTQTNAIVRVNLLNVISCGIINVPTVYNGQIPALFTSAKTAHDLLSLVCERWHPERQVAKAAHALLATMVNTDLLSSVFVSGEFTKALWTNICNDSLDDGLREAQVCLLNHIWKGGKKNPDLTCEALHGWAEMEPAGKVVEFLKDDREFLVDAAFDVLARFLPGPPQIAAPVLDVIQDAEFAKVLLSAIINHKSLDLLLVEEAFTAVIIAGQSSFTDQLINSGKLVELLTREFGDEMDDFFDEMYTIMLTFPETARNRLWQHIKDTPLASHGYSHLATSPVTSDFTHFAMAFDPNAKPKLVSAFVQAIDAIADDGLDEVDPDHITQLLTQLHCLLKCDLSPSLRAQLFDQSQLWDVIRMAMLTPDLRIGCKPLRLVVNNLAHTLPKSIPTIVEVVYAPTLAQIQSKLTDALSPLAEIVKSNRTNPDANDFTAVLMVIGLFEEVGSQLLDLVDGLHGAVVTAICAEHSNTFKDMFETFMQLLEVVLFDEQKHPGLMQKLEAAVEPYFFKRAKEGRCKPTYSTNLQQFERDIQLNRENDVIGVYVQVIAETVEALVHYPELRQYCLDLLPPLAAVLTRMQVQSSSISALMNILQQVPDEDFDQGYHEIGLMYYDCMITTIDPFPAETHFQPTFLTLERLFVRNSLPIRMCWEPTSSALTISTRGNMVNNGSASAHCARGSFGVSGAGKYGFSIRFTEGGFGAVGFTTRTAPVAGPEGDHFCEPGADVGDVVVVDILNGFAWHSGKGRYNGFAGFPGASVTFVLDLDLGQFLVRLDKHGPFRVVFSGLDSGAAWYPYLCQPQRSCSESMFHDDARLTDIDDFIPIGLANNEHIVFDPSTSLVAAEPSNPPSAFTPLTDPIDPPVDENMTIQYYYELEAAPASPIIAAGFRQVHLYSLWIATRGLEAAVQFTTGDMVEESLEWRELVPALVQWYMRRQAETDEPLPDQFAAHFTCATPNDEDEGGRLAPDGWRKWSIAVEPAIVDGRPNIPDDGNVLIVCGIVSKADMLPKHDAMEDAFPLAPYCSDRLLFGVAAVTEADESIENSHCSLVVTKGSDHVYEGDEFNKMVLAHMSELHALPVCIGMQGVKMTMHADVTVEGENALRGPLLKQCQSPDSVLYLTMANWGVRPPGFGDDDDEEWSDEDELDVD
ncbi:hypothetical protein BCR44DRAFT_1440311 [Catenaria anguillulae PL171]|uniref:SPRY domain-containing protein n=1 Tax=Catenaria anguillulae PL171 TaxID=765915 RepID=A0A1Y2HFK3_9FUNG|nr:hypothetical protein BCR44DRAFT_1440311 [Catenaria anguillulae PL171]